MGLYLQSEICIHDCCAEPGGWRRVRGYSFHVLGRAGRREERAFGRAVTHERTAGFITELEVPSLFLFLNLTSIRTQVMASIVR